MQAFTNGLKKVKQEPDAPANDSPISETRHKYGSFFNPTGDVGSHIMIGEGPGAGYNINVPLENGQRGNVDYNAVWDHMLLPVAREFNPDTVITLAGFDAGFDWTGWCDELA